MNKNNPNLAVIILAAGKGTRMNSSKPKVMHDLAGLPMINWLIHSAQTLNPQKIIVVTGPDMPDLQAAAAPHTTVIQETRNGTGGAAKVAAQALGAFDGKALILLGDAPLLKPETMQTLIQTASQPDTGLSLLTCTLTNPHGYGRVITDDENIVSDIVEEKDANAAQKAVTLINSGAFCVDGAHLSDWLAEITNDNAQGEFYITDLPKIAAAKGHKTRAAHTHNAQEILGCNTMADLAELNRLARAHLCHVAMTNGVTIIDPATTYLHHDTTIGAGSIIEPNVFFGPGVTIGANVHIKAFSHLEGATLKDNVTIGPYARLRPDTTLEENVRIGNFVEIKKSTIGAHSKINHLAYVGDTIMAADVNFSAGAITVNYDGFEKHQTIIGKGVMIGSNANLIAPLTIDDGAFIAAGSTITQNVPADSLSISRDPTKIREGWAKEYRKRKNEKKKK